MRETLIGLVLNSISLTRPPTSYDGPAFFSPSVNSLNYSIFVLLWRNKSKEKEKKCVWERERERERELEENRADFIRRYHQQQKKSSRAHEWNVIPGGNLERYFGRLISHLTILPETFFVSFHICHEQREAQSANPVYYEINNEHFLRSRPNLNLSFSNYVFRGPNDPHFRFVCNLTTFFYPGTM